MVGHRDIRRRQAIVDKAHHRARWLLAFVMLLGLGWYGARAQSADASHPAAATDNRILLPKLQGLRFIDSQAKLLKNGFDQGDVTVDGPDLLFRPGIYQRLQQFIGRPFTPGVMKTISAVVTDWYRTNHSPFVQVAFPEQDISNEIVQVLVTGFRIGHIRVQGNNWFSSDLLTSYLNLRPGSMIDTSVLNTDLSRLNQSPYRQVKIGVEPGDTSGAADLVLQTDDRIPFHVFTSYSNNGSPSLGRSNFSLGVEWANVFWRDQDLSYQFTTSDDFWTNPLGVVVKPGRATLQEHQVTYTIPLRSVDHLVIFGNYAEEEPRLGPYLAQLGINWQVSIRYVVDLPSTDTFTEQFQIGYDFKRSNNNLTFGGFAVSQNSTEIDQFPVIYNAGLADIWGRTLLLAEIVGSPGGMSPDNSKAAFEPSADGSQTGIPYASAGYAYADLNITRITQLPFNTSWIFKVNTQASTSNLLASEQLGIGGPETVRGYDERIANGPEGAVVSSEFRSPPVGIIDPVFGTSINDKFQADVFWDFGAVSAVKPIAGDQNTTILDSAGGGVHYVVDRFLDLRFEYGWQLRRAPTEVHRGGEAFLSATAAF